MTARKALFAAVALSLAAGLWLSGSLERPKREIKRTRQAKERSVESRRPEKAEPPKAIGKIKPLENRIFTGVFDRNIVAGRTKFERAVGRDVAVVVLYQSWADEPAFPTRLVDELGASGRVLMVTWEPWRPSTTDWNQPEYSLSKIASGKYDAYLKEWFLTARDARKPVFVRFAHEMNGDWYPWGKHANTPADYIAAWRHVVDLSRASGANNITWVWSPNEVGKQDNLADYYPGDEYVDWIGISGFNWGGLESWQDWRSFNQIFDETLGQISKHNKPVMIAEIGSIENRRPGQQTRAAWITETLDQAKKSAPKISMIVWFDATFEADNKLYDWVIDGSPESVRAMGSGLSDPVFLDRISY